MPTDTPKTDELYAKIWLPKDEDEEDEALETLRDHARQMERDSREYKARLAIVLDRETKLSVQVERLRTALLAARSGLSVAAIEDGTLDLVNAALGGANNVSPTNRG